MTSAARLVTVHPVRAMLPAMVALFRSSTEPTRRSDAPERVSPIWQALTLVDSGLVRMVGQLEVTGTVPPEMRNRPGLIAANHIGMFDPFVLTAALRAHGINPRFLLTGGLLDAPVVGWGLRQGGSIRVDRGKTNVTEAFDRVIAALRSASGPVLVYPEGRISHDPGLWPERGKTGAGPDRARGERAGDDDQPVGRARGALLGHASGSTAGGTSLPLLGSGLARDARPADVQSPLRTDGRPVGPVGRARPGDAVRAHKRIMQAITDGLVPLRTDEPDAPRFHDPTRPTDSISPWRPKPTGD